MSKTAVFQVDAAGQASVDNEAYRTAARVLQTGGLVAFPTETVYGLGADARSAEATERIFQAKGRPSDNPLIVHVPDADTAKRTASHWASRAARLTRAFWPGPLTVIVEHRGDLPDTVTAGLPTVGLRCPNHPVALRLLRESGAIIAAPSANRSGRPSPVAAKHVLEDLDGEVDVVLDGGPATLGLESTIVDLTGKEAVLLRPGLLTVEAIEHVLGERVYGASPETDPTSRPKAPGMKYRHYAPQGELWLVDADSNEGLLAYAAAAARGGDRCGVLLYGSEANGTNLPEGVIPISCGVSDEPRTVAANLYSALRLCDELHCTRIYARTLPSTGAGLAVMNRLLKASGGRVLSRPQQHR